MFVDFVRDSLTAGLVVGFLFLLVAREIRRKQPGGAVGRVPLAPGLRRRMVGVALTIGARDFAGLASLTLTSIYLQKAHGYSVAEAGLVVGSMMLVAIVANPLAVYLSPGKRRLWMLLGILLGGAVVAETVFAWPGLGSLALEAVLGRDFNVLLGILLLSSTLVIVVNIAVDLLHAWLDPRIASSPAR